MPIDFSGFYPKTYRTDQAFAQDLDARDPLRGYREQFFLPRHTDGTPQIYLCSHSLGLQPKAARAAVEQELDHWAELGVEGHFHGPTPWYTYLDALREPASRLVGALRDEVIFMNGLTINLHLMMETFYRPEARRYRILMDEPVFPSDLYAVQSQLRRLGLNPAEALLTVKPQPGESVLREGDVEEFLQDRGTEIALVIWSGVNFLTGQAFDLERIIRLAHEQGCLVGLDVAHAAGNVPLRLHDWQTDFAVWCTYKYLNSGPGAVAGCFVHERHGRQVDLPRLAGWWGNDPATRFRMQLEPQFLAQPGAGGWQVSNPPILALAPVRASLALFDEVGMALLRAKSECLTGYLQYLLEQQTSESVSLLTPREPARRGCQLSLAVPGQGRALLTALQQCGISADFREPGIIRVAPVPLYNTFQEVWEFARCWAELSHALRHHAAH
jgi:kynureninase